MSSFTPTIYSLPTEIYIEILRLLPRRTIQECLLVCKKWNTLAIPLYFEELHLTIGKIEYLHSKMLDKEENRQLCNSNWIKEISCPQIGIKSDTRFYVYYSNEEEEGLLEEEQDIRHQPHQITDQQEEREIIIIESSDENEGEEGETMILDDNSEQVENIDQEEREFIIIDSNDDEEEEIYDPQADYDRRLSLPKFSAQTFSNFLSFLPNLKKIDLTSFPCQQYTFYMDELSKKGEEYLKNLEEINIHPNYPEVHFKTCYTFRHSIKRLFVFYNKYSIDNRNDEYPLSFLPEFIKLIDLSVINSKDSILTCFDMLDACPLLEKLQFDSKFSVSQLNTSVSYRLISGTLSAPRLKVLRLTLPTLTLPYIEFMQKTSQLNFLQIVVYKSLWEDTYSVTNMDLMIKFLHYISKAEQAFIFTVRSQFDEPLVILQKLMNFDQIMENLKKCNQRLHDKYSATYP